MAMTRRSALLTGISATGVGVLGVGAAGAHAATSGSSAAAAKGKWYSGGSNIDPDEFGTWRGSTVGVMGMFGDGSVEAQEEQYQYASSSFSGAVDLAVGGPLESSWTEVAAGADVEHWQAIASVIESNWHSSTVYLRYAHEFNGSWFDWGVDTTEVTAFRTAFRLFRTTMLAALPGRDVKFVFAPNYGTWNYTVESIWPGNDVVDVVGISMYEWDDYSTAAKWTAFNNSSIGPKKWLKFAASHGKPLALAEWGGTSGYFIRVVNDWISRNAGTGSGQVIYDCYLNNDGFELEGTNAANYRSRTWGGLTS